MEWQGGRESENVEDARGMGGGTVLAGGGVGTIVVVLLISAIFGVNPLQLLQQMPQGGGPGGNQVVQPGQVPPGQEELVKFVKVVLAETEDVWTQQFQAQRTGMAYSAPKLRSSPVALIPNVVFPVLPSGRFIARKMRKFISI